MDFILEKKVIKNYNSLLFTLLQYMHKKDWQMQKDTFFFFFLLGNSLVCILQYGKEFKITFQTKQKS